MRVATAMIAVVGIGLFTGAACGRTDTRTRSTEMGRARSSNLDVILLSPDDAIRHGRDSFVVEFRSASGGQLVDVGKVRASATMPMGGGAPMIGGVAVEPGDAPGRYDVSSDLSMAGEWRLSLDWSGPAGQGSVAMTPLVR